MLATDFVDMAFPVSGDPIPADHGYHLFSAISGKIPALHGSNSWSLHAIRGLYQAGTLELHSGSRVQLRIPAKDVPHFLDLTDTELNLAGVLIHLGAPTIYPIRPSFTLWSRIVIIHREDLRQCLSSQIFEQALRSQLETVLGPNTVGITLGRLRFLRVSGILDPGFSVTLDFEDPEASLMVQVKGLGGRRHMGAGVFTPCSRTHPRP